MQSLLDLADRSLTAMTKEERLIASIKKHQCWHVLYPPFFERVNDLPNLTWQSVPFSLQSRSLIPKQKGVYAFGVQFGHAKLPQSCHILYVGKAGDVNTDNTLWRRYYDYIYTQRINDRPRICEMLRQWEGKLVYFYAVVDPSTNTGVIEEYLLDILVPPYNRGDFSAELTNLLKGANII
jgi:hypothetical protein